MQIDRRVFLATLGTAAVIEAMPSETLVERLHHVVLECVGERLGWHRFDNGCGSKRGKEGSAIDFHTAILRFGRGYR